MINTFAFAQKLVNITISPKVIEYSLRLAELDLGKSETNNRGEHIRKYGLAVYGKLIDGFYYCYAGQYWAIDSACKYYKVSNPYPKTGHCATALRIASDKYGYLAFASPSLNDIGFFVSSQGNGHAFRVVGIYDALKWIVKTIEFNTSSDNSNIRNGGMVTYKKRYLKFPLNKMRFRGALRAK